MHLIVAIHLQILAALLPECADSGDILDQVTALTVAHRQVAHTLLCSEECLDDGDGIGDTGGDQSTGEGTEGLTIDIHSALSVETAEAVGILPVLDDLVDGVILGVGDVVGDTSTLVGGEATGDGDLRQKSCVRGPVTYLDRVLDRLGDGAADVYTIVDSGKSVQERAAGLLTLLDTDLSLLVSIETGVAVDGGGK